MNRVSLTIVAILLAFCSRAQATDTLRTFNRGDQNASISTTNRSNVPKAQRQQPVMSKYRPADAVGTDQPDVVLDIPNLSVDEITLDVQNLQVHLALDARVANLFVAARELVVGEANGARLVRQLRVLEGA